MHVDVHWDEANGDGQDVTKGTPRQPTIGNKEDVASAVCSATWYSLLCLDAEFVAHNHPSQEQLKTTN